VRVHEKCSKKESEERTIELLEMVGIPSPRKRYNQYPHEFSGGMQQRAMIAMALAFSPPLLIADEPTTSLDVTIQAQIIELLKDLIAKFKTSAP
jgi:oligopeptide transport system ATP-binding protein